MRMMFAMELLFWLTAIGLGLGLGIWLLRKVHAKRAELESSILEAAFERYRSSDRYFEPSYARERLTQDPDDEAA